MRAVRFDHYGDRDVLYVAEVDMPVPPAGEVVVEVRAAGINPGEASIRLGLLDAMFRLRAAAPNGIDAFIDLFGPEYLDVAVELGIAPDRIETSILSTACGTPTPTSSSGTRAARSSWPLRAPFVMKGPAG